jgi:hypothetical protein
MYRISKTQKYHLESRGVIVTEESTFSDAVARAHQRAIDINDVALVRDLGLIEAVLELEVDNPLSFLLIQGPSLGGIISIFCCLFFRASYL